MNQAILQSKIDQVNTAADRLAECGSAVVVEYRGLSVAEVTELRRALREENVDLKVYKNNISARAAEQAGFGDLTQYLTGPNALAISDDSVAPSRVLVKFAKRHPNLVVKGGLVDKNVLDPAEIQTISALPNKEGMIAMFMGCLQSPIIKFAATVKAIADKDNPTTEENA